MVGGSRSTRTEPTHTRREHANFTQRSQKPGTLLLWGRWCPRWNLTGLIYFKNRMMVSILKSYFSITPKNLLNLVLLLKHIFLFLYFFSPSSPKLLYALHILKQECIHSLQKNMGYLTSIHSNSHTQTHLMVFSDIKMSYFKGFSSQLLPPIPKTTPQSIGLLSTHTLTDTYTHSCTSAKIHWLVPVQIHWEEKYKLQEGGRWGEHFLSPLRTDLMVHLLLLHFCWTCCHACITFTL